MELFFDLAFVVAIASTAHSLSSASSPRALLEFAVLFSLLQWAWVGSTFFNNRFDVDGLGQRLAALLQMALVLALSTMHDWLAADYSRFAVLYGLLRGVTIASNLLAGARNPAARPLTNTYAAGYSLALIPLFAGMCTDRADWHLVLAATTVVLQFVPPLLVKHEQLALRLDAAHLVERMGLFVTLSLGECLVGITHGAVTHGHPTLQSLFGGGLALTIVFCLWWVYFGNVSESALEQPIRCQLLWLLIHTPLTMGIVVLAVGIQEHLSLFMDPREDGRTMMLMVSWAFTALGVGLAATLSRAAGRRRFPTLLALVGALGLCALVVPFLLPGNNPLIDLIVVALLGVVLLAFAIRSIPSHPPQPRRTRKSIH